MNVEALIYQVRKTPELIEFDAVMAVVEKYYRYSPVRFTNGSVVNEAGTNEGSCKIFAFAKLNSLDENETLPLFGKFYREDVLQNPEGTDHANIRNFMRKGWREVNFDAQALVAK